MALTTLDAIERQQLFADEAMTRELAKTGFDQRDRALVMQLVYGVLRHRLALDWRLDHVADRRMKKLPITVAHALRLGAYQLLYLTKIPPSAAVNESVQLVRARMPSPHWTGFANAVLRGLLRQPAPTLPERERDPVASLSLRYSCPAWLVGRWIAQFGPDGADMACRSTCEEPPMTLWVNRLRANRDDVLQTFRQAGLNARTTRYSPDGLVVETSRGGGPPRYPGYDEGWFYVEDEAAQLIPLMLAPQPGERLLDACAAPGGKTIHCAALVKQQGEIVAVDRSDARLATLRANLDRLGAGSVTPLLHDWMTPQTRLPLPLHTPFDRILLDAPCSALGTLRRHPEGKWQKQEETLLKHQQVQRRLLEETSHLLRPGGVIVYSTCSTEPEETVQVIDHFCAAHPEFTRESVAPWIPTVALPFMTDRGDWCSMLHDQGQAQGERMDAFFASRLRRVT